MHAFFLMLGADFVSIKSLPSMRRCVVDLGVILFFLFDFKDNIVGTIIFKRKAILTFWVRLQTPSVSLRVSYCMCHSIDAC